MREDENYLWRFILPALGKKRVEQLTMRDIEVLNLGLEKTPYQANRLLAALSKMFACAMAWGWRSDNPVRGIQKYTEAKRDRWLDEDELKRLWDVLEQYPTHLTALALKLLILTGARKNEVLQATWDQFDLEGGIWTKPSHLTKQKKTEHLPLSPEAIALLHQVKDLNHSGPHLFPGRVPGKPIQETKTFWHRALRQASLENIRIHDLRHTHAAHLVSSGLSLSIVGKLLGHTQASTTQRYAHLSHQSLRQATTLFGAKMTELKERKQ